MEKNRKTIKVRMRRSTRLALKIQTIRANTSVSTLIAALIDKFPDVVDRPRDSEYVTTSIYLPEETVEKLDRIARYFHGNRVSALLVVLDWAGMEENNQ